MMEYVIAYSTAVPGIALNQAIVSEQDVRLAASLHARLSLRGVVYVYEHRPERRNLRGPMVAAVTPNGWFPT